MSGEAAAGRAAWWLLLGAALAGCGGGAPDETGASTADGGAVDGGAVDGGADGGADGGGDLADGGTDGGTDGGADGGTDGGGGEDPLLRVVINELVPDNEGSTRNEEATTEEAATADWIELYNPGPEAVDLAGCGVSDDWTRPLQYVLPEGTIIAGGGHLLLWAEGAALPSGLRLPFALSADGESVGLFTPAGEAVDWVGFGPTVADTAWARIPDGSEAWEEVPVGTPGQPNQRLVRSEEEVIPAGASWAFRDVAEAPDPGWTGRGYDDTAWSRGAAPLGYGEDVATVLSYGPDPNDKHATAWFRARFTVPEGRGLLSGGTVSIRVDDGAAVYLDGEELLRHNLPAGELTADTLASATVSGGDETAWSAYALPARALEPGEAVLAVEVHQAAPTSSDLVLDLSLTLERIEPE